MKQTGKGPKAHTKAAQEGSPKDRKSGSGVSGSPKKGGHGGKFTWAGDGLQADMDYADVALDAKDPNFEESEENAEIVNP